jgi:branched-subunit amino acid ABC-type transport system permease component
MEELGRGMNAAVAGVEPSLIWPAVVFGMVSAAILTVSAVGFTLQFAISEVLNLAFPAIMAVSGYVAYLLNAGGMSIWVAMLAGAGTGAVLSVACADVVYRPFKQRGASPFTLVVVALGLGIAIQGALELVAGPGYFSYSLPQSSQETVEVFSAHLSYTQLYVIAIAAASMVLVHLLLRRTHIGRAMRATAGNLELARHAGIPADRIIRMVWIISGLLCGIGGVILFLSLTTFTATTGNSFVIMVAAAAFLGGVGEPYGAMLGALVLGITASVAGLWIPAYQEAVGLLLLIGVLLLRPEGIRTIIARGASGG